MSNIPEIPPIYNEPLPAHILSRREVVRRLLTGLASGAAAPLLAASHPIRKHLSDDSLLKHADKKLGDSNWKPAFLNEQQNEALIALSEAIVPGSKNALVDRFIDLLLSVDTIKNQQEFAASLATINDEAQHRFGHAFPSATHAQQNTLLAAASSGELSRESTKTLRDHFENLKGWITGAYYSSEPGMTELGWTGDRFFETFPGCRHPDGHT